MRIKRGVGTHKHHKRIIEKTKGYQKTRTNLRKAKEALLKAGQYAYRDRRNKKRERRRFWILKINGALKKHHLSYSRFMHGLTQTHIELDRKILAHLVTVNPETFEKIVRIAQKTLETVK